MQQIPGLSGSRRLNPKPWDYCAYVLRRVRTSIQRALESELAEKTESTVVDFGCGDRPYEPLFARWNCRYVAADIVGNPSAELTYEVGEPVPFEDEAADLVLSTDVLAHVINVSDYLRECRRLLKQDGLLVLTTHGVWTYCPYPTDVRRWTWWGLRHEIEAHGFRVESLAGCLGPLAYTTQLRLQLLRGLLLRFGLFGRAATNALSCAAQATMWFEDYITPFDVRHNNSAVYIVSARKTNR